MHAKTDSEVTSLAPSSPDNRRPVYFVQSPSHDGEKTTISFHSTPAQGSPSGSPPHSQSSVCHHSRESSTSRFSGSLKPGSRKISPNEAGSGGKANRKGGGRKNFDEFDVIEEEGLLLDHESRNGLLPRRCYFLAFIVGFFLLFSLFALILWGASKPQTPKIAMKSIRFESFVVQAGSDSTGVSTGMISVNATLKFSFRNTGTFFGVHVSSTPLDLLYSDLRIASGHMNEFSQSRRSSKNVTVIVVGDQIPLYGIGASLSTQTPVPVPLDLNFTVESRADVLGKLVKTRFHDQIGCSIEFDTTSKLNVPILLKNYC
ncbi:hypothetical protein M569_15857, partial [Genlisea aurea]